MTPRASRIPHSRPTLDEEDHLAVTDVLRTGQVAQGPVVERFERAMAGFVGVKGGVAVTSGTAALELALRVMGIGPGDEVILPSYVCAAPWVATLRVGAQPRLVDIRPDTYTIDPDQVPKAMSSRTRAILVPHQFGLPADLTKLETLGIPLIEDCAQTLGAMETGRPVGTVGKVTVCSFYATKLLCTGEGGMVLSNEETFLERARAFRQYDESPKIEEASGNYKLTDLQAALGLSQLNKISDFLRRRRAIAEYYHGTLAGHDLILPHTPEGRTHVFYRYVVRIPRLIDRPGGLQDLLTRLEHRGVQCRRPVYRALHRYLELGGFPQSEEASETAVSIPLYPSMTDDEMIQTVEALCEEVL